jgi:hypothetical protein
MNMIESSLLKDNILIDFANGIVEEYRNFVMLDEFCEQNSSISFYYDFEICTE